jgi:hypothetical protein
MGPPHPLDAGFRYFSLPLDAGGKLRRFFQYFHQRLGAIHAIPFPAAHLGNDRHQIQYRAGDGVADAAERAIDLFERS